MSLVGSVGFVSACAKGGLEDSVALQAISVIGSVVLARSLSIQTTRCHRHSFLKFLEVELTGFISVAIIGNGQRCCPLLLSA